MAGLQLEGKGLEIGPSHSPVAPKSAGYRVEIIDCLDQAGLVEKYRDHGVNVDAIEEVDYVWQGGDYESLIGESACYDWIIASHVVEHAVDFVGFLENCARILKPEGTLSLAVPDKRFCFDRF